MRARKELVEGGSCHLSRVPNLCSLSIISTACVIKSSSTKSSVTEYSIFEFPASFRLVVFKFRYGCKEPKCSNDFEAIDTDNCCAISPYSRIRKQDNTKITPPKNPIAGVRECEFWFIKYRCFAGYDFFLTLAYWFVLALLAFNNLLLISRWPAQISRCLSRRSTYETAYQSLVMIFHQFSNVSANRSTINPC